MSTDSIRCPSPSSWTAFAVSPPSAPITCVSAIVLNRNASASASRSSVGRSVRSSKEDTSGRLAPARTWFTRYAGSPRASSHAASDAGAISLIAGGGPASVSSVTPAEDEPHVVEERQQRGEHPGHVRPGGGFQDVASAGVALPGHPETIDEGERLARRADLDRERREGEEHRR